MITTYVIFEIFILFFVVNLSRPVNARWWPLITINGGYAYNVINVRFSLYAGFGFLEPTPLSTRSPPICFLSDFLSYGNLCFIGLVAIVACDSNLTMKHFPNGFWSSVHLKKEILKIKVRQQIKQLMMFWTRPIECTIKCLRGLVLIEQRFGSIDAPCGSIDRCSSIEQRFGSIDAH